MTALKGSFGKLRQTFNSTASGQPFNYERVAAYQLVAAHFYTNDAVDFVYEAISTVRSFRTALMSCTPVSSSLALLISPGMVSSWTMTLSPAVHGPGYLLFLACYLYR